LILLYDKAPNGGVFCATMLDMDTTAIKIEDLGWDVFFESKRAELGLADFPVARIIAEYKGGYKVKNENGEFLAKITGKQIFNSKSRADYPAIGDWTAITELDNKQAVIQSVFPRKSIIKRRFGDKNKIGEKNEIQIIATNIDVAFIVQSVGRDYNINRFERYIAVVEDGGIKPAIIVNKIDLISAEELNSKLMEIKNRLGDIDVILTSTVNDKGLSKLKNYIEKGKTYCFLGSSGVGKSSLINKLLGKNIIKTENISAYSDRGKHITTNRETYFLENGGILIDNPGVREIGMTNISAGIDSLFDEITALANKCKYADCTHIHEPGCEILLALKDGRIEREKYLNYISLKKEAEYFEMNGLKRKEKDRNFGKFMKKAKKELKNYGHKYF
jgi:ribosome biogenesis GTPase / thiamine phosphate phosphatase